MNVPILARVNPPMSDHKFSGWLTKHGWQGDVIQNNASALTSFLVKNEVIANVLYSASAVKAMFIRGGAHA